MNLANTIKAMYESKQDFEPHMMYDPETGKGYKAEKPEDHERMKKLGYTHEKPEDDLDESFEEAMVDLEEARIKASDYEATSEKSKFGGHRPTVVHKTKGTTLWLGAVGFKTPKAAKAAADAYLSGYAIGSEKGAKRMLDAHIKNNKKNLVDPSILDEANMSDVKKQLGKVKGLSKDAYNQLVTLPMPVLTTMVNQLSGLVASYDMKEEVELDENQVMSAQFKVGDMPNSDLHNSIEKLKTAKKKADAQKPKVSDPVLVKSLNDVIGEIDKTIKDAEKAQAAASKAIAKVAPSIKRTFELINKKRYLLNSFEAEGDQLDEAYQQFTDKTANWGEGQAVAFGRKKGYKEVAVMSDNNSKHPMVLFALDSGDKKYIKGSNVKSGETVFRYATKISIAGDIFPLVKVNIAKGIYYNLTQESSEGTIEDAKFENKGVKLKFFRSLEGAIKESVELDEAKFGDNDLVHIAKANVRAPNNAKTDKIIGYSKAPKNPNKFPDPKSGANAIMRIADAKKKGFKIESAELNEDYFMVQYYDKKGKADTTKFSKFDNEQKAKKYLDRANKVEKEGKYKMFKVKGKMESKEMNESNEKYISLINVQLDEANKSLTPYLKKAEKFMMPSKNKDQGIEFVMKGMKVDKKKATEIVDTILKIKGGQRGRVTFMESNENVFGTAKNHGISDSLLDAVNAVVTGQAETVEVESEPVQEPEQIDEDNTNNKSDDGEGLDKVQPKAVKKKFKDRKDKDIDNDGDVDSSDKYLHKKRKAISKAIDKDDSEEKNVDKEEDKKDVKSGKKEKVDLKPKLDEATFKSKYGSRWESVMEATIKRLAEQQELNEKFTLLKDKDIAPLVLALKDNISVELKDPKNNNLLVTMQTTDDGVQVKYKTGRNTKVGTEKSPMPAIRSAVKFLKAKQLAFREL